MAETVERLGTLYGIGAGPGDPELLTMKGFRLLRESPVIAYPKKRMGSRSYALDIVEAYVNPEEKTMLGLVFPMTRDPEVLRREWDHTAALLLEHLRAGRDVAFVTEGDPLLYSTFIHMARVLHHHAPDVRVVAVPGVSSVNGGAARLGLPLADGDEVVAIVPATRDMAKMRAAIEGHDCVVFLKVAKVMDPLIDLLDEMGLLQRARVISRATSGEEEIWEDVRALRGVPLNYLTLMVVKR
ncbi:precorrin-2 C(20)-methyltransferase [Alicyclobacillus macrosporangiidus]|uniref:Precorrin-2/cobalt-factor-2 C20-methyltransferase n=1 Tax=Alicyclobacillus macrosporangiidus TaxID=392015 RepID=A0A1I7JJY4_9BACL|nr:precorrin-2 C(20)-methyltransferase [Alicyclobacillus macrosporangiidus]SFU85470.1 precorrin-2/cobalt-factor-2 C20-methyltransferase [Alicyclobacillus macrosporangiidus]